MGGKENPHLLVIPKELIQTLSLIKAGFIHHCNAGCPACSSTHRKQRYVFYTLLPNVDFFLPWFFIG